MRTTLTLDDEVILGIKKLQKKRPDASFKQIVNDVMKKGLRAENGSVNTPFKVEPGREAKPKSGINYDKISDLLAIAEGDDHR